MKKKSDTQMAFLDLMLCAIGCALMIFTAQVPQPRGRGRGWDDRPLVVRAWATGPLNSQFRWELVREAARGSGDLANGVATPQERITRSGQTMLFIVPEAEFGAWKLAVEPRAQATGLESLARQLQEAGAFAGQQQQAVRAHLEHYDRYLGLLDGAIQPDKLAAFHADLRKAIESAPSVVETTGFGLPLSRREDVELYLKYRRLVMQAVLLAKAQPAANNPERQRIENEIAALLNAPPGKSGDKRIVGVKLGIEAEDELRRLHQSGSACAALNGKLEANQRFSDREATQNDSYACYLGEYIRWRAIDEHLPPERKADATTYRSRIPNYQANLQSTAVLGRNDQLFRLIAYEIRSLGKGDRPIEANFAIIWGDKRWPVPEPGQSDSENPTEKVQLSTADLWSAVPLATINLPKDLDRPVVTIALR